MFYILCGFLCYLSAACWEFTREFTFWFVCVCLSFCVCTLTTLILYVEPLAWEPAHFASTSPRLFLPHSLVLSLSLCRKPSALKGERVTLYPQTPTELSLNSSKHRGSTREEVTAGWFSLTHTRAPSHADKSTPICTSLHERRSWPAAMNSNPLTFTKLGHRE